MTLKVMVKLCVERQTAWCRPDWENRKQLKTHSLHIQNILKVVLTILTGIMRLTDADADFPNIHSILISWLYFFCPHSNSSNSSNKQTIRKYEQENMPGLPKPLGMQLQESDKGQISYWSIQTCSRIMLLFDGLLTMLKKPQNCPISDFFDLYPNTFCPYCLIQTWYRLLLTQYHQVPTSTAIYWPCTTKCQAVPAHTDLVLPSTSQYRCILTKYHQVPIGITLWFNIS